MSAAIIFATFALVVAAAAFDVRTRRVPNVLPVTAWVLAVVWHCWQGGWGGLALSLGGFAAGLALMLPGWLMRFTGGGDVKLLAAVGSLIGPEPVVYAFGLSMLAGAIMGVMFAAYAWARKGATSPARRYGTMFTLLAADGRLTYIRPAKREAVGKRFPLAPAIAVGSVAAAVWFS